MVSRDTVVVVDEKRCTEVALLIRGLDVPDEREDFALPELPADLLGNYFLALVAICHQTSPYGGPPLHGSVDGRWMRGWDYLASKLAYSAERSHHILEPAFWAHIEAVNVRDLFLDESAGDTLSDAPGRALLLRDLGGVMLQRGWLRADEIQRYCGGWIARGERALVDELGRFRAYSDPVRKKTYYLLALMHGTGLWQFQDLENIGPPVDYHECRGHLRLETVVVRSPGLASRLFRRERVTPDEDIAIRDAVARAITTISGKLDGVSPMRLHYLFWNVFRACCKRENPHCQECPEDCELPERYWSSLNGGAKRACHFVGLCPSATRRERIQEPVVETEYY